MYFKNMVSSLCSHFESCCQKMISRLEQVRLAFMLAGDTWTGSTTIIFHDATNSNLVAYSRMIINFQKEAQTPIAFMSSYFLY